MANRYTKTKIDTGEAINLYELGMTQGEVGKKLGVSQKIIYERFKECEYKCRKAVKRNQTGEKNHNWKGKDAKYAALHYRVQNVRGKPSKCSMCETEKAKRFEWANVTGDYSNVFDYIRLCKSCHSKFDNVIINIIGERL